MTVTFDGEERTLPQMAKYLEETDRARRQASWEAVAARRLQDRTALDRCYAELLALRHTIARNAGFPSYREYVFRARSRFDYTPRDCEAFHRAVAECAVPLARELQARRARLLGLSRLRPWDLSVDPRGRPYYWIGGEAPTGILEEGTDFGALKAGYVSITPLHLDLTAREAMEVMKKWEWK